jgi:hypothetical protein
VVPVTRVGVDDEAFAAPPNTADALACPDRHTEAPGLRQQRVEDGARSVRLGKQLPIAFLAQRDAEIAKKRNRMFGGERAEHLADESR